MQNYKSYSLIDSLKSDIYRYAGGYGIKLILRNWILIPGFRFIVSWRIAKYCSSKKILKYNLGLITRIIWMHYAFKFGFDIPLRTDIDLGFRISHFGMIIINGHTKIGRNVTILQGVLIGETNRGKKIGAPIIGDGVHIGAGVKIIGGIRIGNNVSIGANAVVTDDIPDNAVVVGIPAKIISFDGAREFITNKI